MNTNLYVIFLLNMLLKQKINLFYKFESESIDSTFFSTSLLTNTKDNILLLSFLVIFFSNSVLKIT